MATPATPSNSGQRWARSGDPASPFNGPTRPGRGAGRGRGGPRGGRGAGRGFPSNKESKPEDILRSNSRSDISQPPQTPPAKPSGSSPLPPATVSEKLTPQSKPKPPASRRASRITPAAINTQPPSVEISSAQTTGKGSNRRRRSQSGKLTQIIPPAPNDNLLRPNKSRLDHPPHSAPIKDAPPHLSQRFDIRNDIDALVERVRAVAMDNRPLTPGSHIDWAGDDDDSLPDLDDWGVTPASLASSKADAISPIIVGSLKPLPDISTHSIPASPSPLKQVLEIAYPTLNDPPPQEQEQDLPEHMSTSFVSQASTPKPEIEVKPVADHSPSRKPLHPSLPAKPNGASLMRASLYPKSAGNAAPDSLSGNVPKVSDQHFPPDRNADNQKTPQKPEDLAFTSDATVEVPRTPASPLEGLAASMHAPKAITDSFSAPANISSYSELSSEHPGSTPTHTRAHTVGRPYTKPTQNEYVPRFSRSGQSTPRGGFNGGGYHSRTHSSPPTGALANNRGGHNATRPVITGDAISRLARTIGRTGLSATPTKPPQ